MEYLEFHDPTESETMNTTSPVFPSACRWTSHIELEISVPRSSYAVVSVGSCLIVLGAFCLTDATNAEVLDTCRNNVWTITRSTGARYSCSAVVHTKGIAVISGENNASCATLSLIDRSTSYFRDASVDSLNLSMRRVQARWKELCNEMQH